jgi:hypothetical protein
MAQNFACLHYPHDCSINLYSSKPRISFLGINFASTNQSAPSTWRWFIYKAGKQSTVQLYHMATQQITDTVSRILSSGNVEFKIFMWNIIQKELLQVLVMGKSLQPYHNSKNSYSWQFLAWSNTGEHSNYRKYSNAS